MVPFSKLCLLQSRLFRCMFQAEKVCTDWVKDSLASLPQSSLCRYYKTMTVSLYSVDIFRKVEKKGEFWSSYRKIHIFICMTSGGCWGDVDGGGSVTVMYMRVHTSKLRKWVHRNHPTLKLRWNLSVGITQRDYREGWPLLTVETEANAWGVPPTD